MKIHNINLCFRVILYSYSNDLRARCCRGVFVRGVGMTEIATFDPDQHLAELPDGPDARSRDADLKPQGYGSTNSIGGPSDQRPTGDYSQWMVAPNGKFFPASQTVPRLAAGCYMPGHCESGVFLERMAHSCDTIVDLPEMATAEVLAEIQRYWASREMYEAHGLLYKRGVLLWGPPGSGKTMTVNMLAREIIRRDGLVLFCKNPGLLLVALKALRQVEPARDIIVVLEDIDELVAQFSEHDVLALLDGESNISNVVYVATTNYPDRLGARIVNRPSRFDRRIYVGMPSATDRAAYLCRATSNGKAFDKTALDRWVRDTDGMSIAHLRELVAAVLCLGQDYADVLKRLKSMARKPETNEDGYARKAAGF